MTAQAKERGAIRLRLTALAALGILAGRLDACTLWGTVVTNAAGGTIMAKNRDWAPDHTQVLKMHRDNKGLAYFGLYAVGGSEPGIKAGVNEKGLSVVTASASCIPKSERDDQPGKHAVLSALLSGYATCDEVLAKREAIFPKTRAMFVMISDRSKILMVEVGLGGTYALKAVESGFITHANHFLDPGLAAFNEKIGLSSTTRLKRVTELMNAEQAAYTAESFVAMSRDQYDGPDNSLWRTGSGKGTRTLASWIVETPARGVPKLRVVLANPSQPEETRTVILDEAFWSK
jgi:hypothetical protein